jgi:hypothetical protein
VIECALDTPLHVDVTMGELPVLLHGAENAVQQGSIEPGDAHHHQPGPKAALPSQACGESANSIGAPSGCILLLLMIESRRYRFFDVYRGSRHAHSRLGCVSWPMIFGNRCSA